MTSTTHWRQFHTRRNTMRKLSFVFMVLSLMCFAVPAFAQGGPTAAAPVNWVAIAAGFSMAIASAICGLAQGRAAAAEALTRNPAARPGITFALILGLALIESLALYTLAIIIVKVKELSTEK